MNRILKSLATVGLVGVISLVAGCSGDDPNNPTDPGQGQGDAEQQGPPPANVRLAPVEMRTVQEHRLVTGRIRAAQRSTIASEESGRVIVAPPDIGTTVKADDVLAELDRDLVETGRRVAVASREEAQANIEQARATLDQARALRERYDKLIDQGGITQVALDQAVRDEQVAQAQLANARARLASSQAQIEELDIRLKKMTIRAPFDGAIVSKDTEVGQWLSPGSPVVTLVRTDKVDAELHVPERMLAEMAEDQTIVVTIQAAGGEFEGRIYRIVPDANAMARTFPVLIRMDNPEGRIKPGMSAEAQLPTGDRIRAMLVPRDAVQVTPTGMMAYANRGGAATPVPLSVRFTLGDQFVVDAPLEPVDQVVVEGNERLHPGAPIAPQSAGAAPNTP